jgi:hypothetical protein
MIPPTWEISMDLDCFHTHIAIGQWLGGRRRASTTR